MVHMDNDPKHAKATQEILKAKKWDHFHWTGRPPDLNWTERAFQVTEDKTKSRETHKDSSKGLTGHVRGGNRAFGEVHKL